jgi:hypothetical protein
MLSSFCISVSKQWLRHRSDELEKSVRALGCVIVALMTVLGMRVLQHYSAEPPSRALTAAVAITAMFLTWFLTGLE